MALLLIPLFPLISFVILILIGRRLGKLAPAVSLIALMGSALLSLLIFASQAFFTHATNDRPPHISWTWLSLGGRPLTMGFQADALSTTMCLVVTIIGFFIMLYSIGYMAEDKRFSRFFAYLSLFFFAMLTLVLADNFLLLYIGWEGVGLCSYLLISFWFERPAAANAGKKAFLTTRVGDLGLFGAIVLLALRLGDLSFAGLEAKAVALGAMAPAAALLILWGACGKSAQFPLHVWLPDAMEGPTPVSALIHAATMVAAGIYLVARTLPLFLPNPNAMLVVAAVGGFTSFFAATIACTQTDMKQILAYSTLSQLGLMMLALGCGSAFAGMFHLVTHAWFKALLFLGAGSVIHAMHHQEITRMGGLLKTMPVTAITFIIASIAMAGIPPLSGFWSKEEILAAAAGFSPPAFPGAGQIFLWLVIAISGMTAFYMTRAVALTFLGKPRELGHHAHDSEITSGAASSSGSHESPLVMTGPLMALSIGAITVGLLGSEWGGHFFQHFLGAAEEGHHASEWIAVVSVAVAVSGILLAFLRYSAGLSLLPERLRAALRPVYQVVANKYYVDEFYGRAIIQPVLRLTRRAFSFDQQVVDGAVNRAGEAGVRLSRANGLFDQYGVDGAVNGIGFFVGRAGATVRLIQTGLVQNYLLIASAGAVVLFLLLGWGPR